MRVVRPWTRCLLANSQAWVVLVGLDGNLRAGLDLDLDLDCDFWRQ